MADLTFRDRLIVMIASAAILGVVGDAFAVGPSTNPTLADAADGRPPIQPTPPTESDSNAEASALALVQSHLPELKGLLQRLRDNEPRQYQRAIGDLARSARKLEAAKNRDPRLFEIEVETLKAQSAVSLLTAKLKVRDHAADRKTLLRALLRLQQAQVARAQYDVAVLESRLQRAQQQLQNAEDRLRVRREGLNQDVEEAFAAALKKAGRQPEPELSDSQRANRRTTEQPTEKNRGTK